MQPMEIRMLLQKLFYPIFFKVMIWKVSFYTFQIVYGIVHRWTGWGRGVVGLRNDIS